MNNIQVKSTDILIWLCAILFILLFPHTGIFPVFTYTIPSLFLIWFVLKKNSENFATLGFRFNGLTFQAAGVGIATGVALFAFMHYLFFPVIELLVPLAPANLKDFDNIRHHLPMYLFVVTMGWVVGGIYEEIVFHGFIFTRIEKVMGGDYRTPIAVAITAVIFGAYHFQLGWSGIINALVVGLGYHLLMLRFGRNLWYAFFAHGAFDSIAITLIYLGYW